MIKRRDFIKTSAALGVSTTAILSACNSGDKMLAANSKLLSQSSDAQEKLPLVISTWNNQAANQAAFDVIKNKGTAVDAVEVGVQIPEADPNDQSVGYGGRPDREGNVTLDACIMDSKGNYGAVTYLQHIKHPIAVARKVMDETPHVMLSGDGALQFALSQGFKKEELLTEKSKEDYKEWLKTSEYKPKVNIELHDTIGMIAIDGAGDISGACTTSGLAYKLPGRIGDSPIIGAGLFVDNEIGAATATGMGEAVLRSVGSFLIVELMRNGLSPADACKEAVMRIIQKQSYKDLQVGYLAVNKQGEYGAFAIQPGFVFALTTNEETKVIDAISYL